MSSVRKIYVGVVDDESSLCVSLSRLLRLHNFDPICYGSAEEFLADQNAPQFDCLLLDVRLGRGMSGLDLFRLLCARGTHPPVLFLTAHDEPEVRAQAEGLGCSGFFHKTSPGSEIVAAIRWASPLTEGQAKEGSGARWAFGETLASGVPRGGTDID